MNKWLLLAVLLNGNSAIADDYSEGRALALNAGVNAMSGLGQLAPAEYLNNFTDHPSESNINQSRLKEEGAKASETNETAQHILDDKRKQDTNPVTVDFNSEEMIQSGRVIEDADGQVSEHKLPCNNGACLPTPDTNGDDFGEGVSQLGTLAGASDDVSAKQIGSGNASIFTGTNNQCRIAVLGIGNCCGGHARFLNCRQEEKSLANSIIDGRAYYVGTYCAHYKKLTGCLEHKQSWCVFPSKLASIIQVQGRLGQLGINFGWVGRRTNGANCRGITPEELARIPIQNLDLSSLTKEFESRAKPKNPTQMESRASKAIEQMEQEGRAHD
jgi:hypothetical protein